MRRGYLEERKRATDLPADILADVVRHYHARQNLGKAAVISGNPTEDLATAQRHWLKLSRTLQRRRGFSSNAVEILKYTYTIAEMQHRRFTDVSPRNDPEAHVFMVAPETVATLPANCWTVYLMEWPGDERAATLARELAPSGLLVDYTGRLSSGDLGLRPRIELEAAVAGSWKRIEAFLAEYGIVVSRLEAAVTRAEAMDDAVDTLLGVDAEFLALAAAFQRTLDLARPLRGASKVQRNLYERFVMLAHRVQTFASTGFSPQFLGTYVDDSFFLQDAGLPTGAALAADIVRHEAAGRHRLARALMARQTATSRASLPPILLSV